MSTDRPTTEELAIYLHDITAMMLVMFTSGMWLQIISQSTGMVQHES